MFIYSMFARNVFFNGERPDSYSCNELIALPEGTVYKQLPNGLHYVIKQNDMPGHKVEFRLILRAGSILQTRRKAV